MRRMIVLFLCISFCFILIGCENTTTVKSGHISEITGALSADYAIKVTLDNDDRVKEKYVDLQIKSSNENQFLTFGEENANTLIISLPKKDYWYNLTYLITQSNGISNDENYKKYEDFGNRVYMFKTQNDVELTFRVVAGQTKTNNETGEEILVLAESISDEVVLKLKKAEKK